MALEQELEVVGLAGGHAYPQRVQDDLVVGETVEGVRTLPPHRLQLQGSRRGDRGVSSGPSTSTFFGSCTNIRARIVVNYILSLNTIRRADGCVKRVISQCTVGMFTNQSIKKRL